MRGWRNLGKDREELCTVTLRRCLAKKEPLYCFCHRGVQPRYRSYSYPAPYILECKAVLIFDLTGWQALLSLPVKLPSKFTSTTASELQLLSPTADPDPSQQCSCHFSSLCLCPFQFFFPAFLVCHYFIVSYCFSILHDVWAIKVTFWTYRWRSGWLPLHTQPDHSRQEE